MWFDQQGPLQLSLVRINYGIIALGEICKGKEKKMSNIEERVKKIIVEQLGVDEAEAKNESSFVEDLGADSLDTVRTSYGSRRRIRH